MNATRRQAREWAIQILTAADLNPGEPPEKIVADFWNQLSTLDNEDGGVNGETPRGKLKAFAEARALGVLGNLKDIDAAIERLLQQGNGWDLSRLGTVERAVLRAGVWELANTDIPKGVVINEAIDLANWFSSPRSRSLINGILDKYAKGL